MSKQRNEPNDILSEVMDYDEEKVVGGTTEDDGGDESSTIWPSHMNKGQLTEKQQKVWREWVRSKYKKPTSSNIIEFSRNKDYSKPTARKVIMQGERERRELKDLRESEKLAAIIWAYEGLDKTPPELEKRYPISDDTFNRVQFSYDDLIKDVSKDYGEITSKQIEKYTNRYKDRPEIKNRKDGSSKYESKSTLANPTGWRAKAKEYAVENPSADAKEIKVETGISADLDSIQGYWANLKGYGYIESEETNQREETESKESEKHGLEIALTFSDDEVLDLINGENATVDVRKRVVEKVVEKAFQ